MWCHVMSLLPGYRVPTTIIALSGVLGHVLFNRLEPRGPTRILSLLLGPPAALAFILRSSFGSPLVASLVTYAVYIGTLVCSVVAYRISPFHPLAGFPGPIICKVTRLWACYIAQTGKQRYYYRSLHARYGTHVRTGPNHLDISDVDAVPTVLGANGFHRGSRYDVGKLPGTTGSLISVLDPHEHAQRRRIWDRGLNTSAVQEYQEILASRITQLICALEQQQGDVDLSTWLSFFAFDFMGDLAFGGAFRLMERGDADSNMRMAGLSSRFTEAIGTIPWIIPFQKMLPGVQYSRRLIEFAKSSVLARKAQGSWRKDIFYYLLDEEGIGSGPLSLPTLIMESVLAIIAGSDTTGTALSNLFFYLLSSPGDLTRLQAEVDSTFPSGSDALIPSVLGNMKFLNAVINETLRLQPPVPNGVQRVVPRGRGTIVAGRFVPELTTVQVPTYTVHRDPRYFSPDPDAFRPERWLSSKEGELKLEQSAYFPFSYGPMNCAGKSLALQELRTVVCSLLQKFEFEFAPDWDPRDWERNLLDHFLLVKGRLPVVVKVRK